MKETYLVVQGVGPDQHVMFPTESPVCFIIDTLARYVIKDGTDFEQLILEAEYDNPEYHFLRNVHSPEHLFYRWRLWSLCNDDELSKWRTEPFVMIKEGPLLIPPPLHAMTATPHEMTAAQLGTPAFRPPHTIHRMTCTYSRRQIISEAFFKIK